MIQLYIIKLGAVEIHRQSVFGEENYQHPLDYLKTWLEKSQFKIPISGITIEYLGAQIPISSVHFTVYDHLQICLPVHGDSYREVQDLWYMRVSYSESVEWYIQYEDDMVYTTLRSKKGHCGCTGEGNPLMSGDASELLEKFLNTFHADRVAHDLKFK